MEVIIKTYWDCFTKEGLQKPIRGYLFSIDTGNVEPVCVKTPRYGPHEARVINKLIDKLEDKGLIEDDDGPWGASIVLASKPNQDHAHWTQFIFRLCVSYRKLNAVTRPFAFPITRCDDAILDVEDREYMITMDLDSGYWQMLMDQLSKAKTAFFVPEGKKRWNRLPMGIKNAAPAFVQMITEMKKETISRYNGNPRQWLQDVSHIISNLIKGDTTILQNPEELTSLTSALQKFLENMDTEFEIQNGDPGASCIIDDVLLYARTVHSLLAFFIALLSTFQHHCITVNLRKTRFLPARAEFVGYDLIAEGNTPAKSKYTAIEALKPPELFSDLRMFIGLLGFYQQWLPVFEPRIDSWREIIKKRPRPGTPREEEAATLRSLWKPPHDTLLEQLKKEILSGPVLRRANFRRRFYLKTDWSKWAMAAVILQAEDSKEAEDAMNREIHGQVCEFEKTLGKLRLRPITFVSRKCKEKEQSYHSATGEKATGHWAMTHPQLQTFLWLKQFTWITDCFGNIRLKPPKYAPTHQEARWDMDMLRYDFTIVHRPERMMNECNLLSRYNGWTSEWRKKSLANLENNTTEGTTAMTHAQLTLPSQYSFVSSNIPITISTRQTPEASEATTRTELATICDSTRDIWIINAEMETVTEAMQSAGIQPRPTEETSEDRIWQAETNYPNLDMVRTKVRLHTHKKTEWIICPCTEDIKGEAEEAFLDILETLRDRALQAIVLIFKDNPTQIWEQNIRDIFSTWECKRNQIENHDIGGTMKRRSTILIAAPKAVMQNLHMMIETQQEPSPMTPHLDPPNSKYSDYLENVRMIHEDNRRMKVKIQHDGNHIIRTVHDPDGPAPDINNPEEKAFHWEFLIETYDGMVSPKIRPIRFRELCKIIGVHPDHIEETTHISTPTVMRHLRSTCPKETIEEIVRALFQAETTTTDRETEALSEWRTATELLDEHDHNALEREHTDTMERYMDEEYQIHTFSTFTTRVINRWTTIPIPDNTKWIEEYRKDPDTSYIIDRITQKEKVKYSRLSKENKSYFKEWIEEKLEVEEGILYQWEQPKATKIRQLRRRVVPKGMRRIVIIAFHSTPLAGHVGIYKTYWRIATRYWWPHMMKEIKEAVTQCGHCVLGNNANHPGHKIWKAITTAEPFDIISMDIWHPGITYNKNDKTNLDLSELEGAVLTSLCNTTAFTTLGDLKTITSDEVRRVAFQQIFVPNGLPLVVLIDPDSVFKGIMIDFVKHLGVKYHMVPPEAHDGILCERFHKYLNKVLKLIGADRNTHQKWRMDVSFATYAWNAAPVDGTDIIRSFAAKARTFRFPLEIQEAANESEAIIPSEGEATVQHIETMFPLWYQQKELLKLLNDTRRERHREIKNRARTQRIFQPGDIVIVRKQVKSNARIGRPEKLTLKPKGPYRVIEKDGNDRYKIQRIPTVQGVTRKKGKILTESSVRMEKLPSTIVIHKRMDTLDTRMATEDQPLIHNPLEKNLGFFEFGKYTTAPTDNEFAFEKVGQIWNEEIESDSESNITESDEEQEEESNEEIKEDQESQDDETIKRSNRKRTRKLRKVTIVRPKTTKQALKELWKATEESKDKLFIIRNANEQGRYEYFIVQVDWEETSRRQALQEGIYHARFYVKNQTDAKTKKVKLCRQYPLVRELLKGGWPGAMIQVHPDKVEKFLDRNATKYFWYQNTVNLKDDFIAGPFDFNRDPMFTIPDMIWDELKERATEMEIDDLDINRVEPFPTKREATRQGGNRKKRRS